MLEIVLLIGMLVCYLWGISYSEGNKDSYLSLGNTTRIKGFFALVILAHHIIQFGNNHNGIVLHKAGYIGVAVFLFYSGYGLMYKLRTDSGYLKGFFKKRILKILYPFVITYILYIIEDYIYGTPHSIVDIVKSFVNGVPYGSGTWYVIFIIVFYCYFWLAATLTKSDVKKVIWATGIFVVLWFAFCYVARYGQVWFVSTLALFIGVCWDEIKDKIHKLCEKSYVVTLLISFAIFMILNYFILVSQGGTQTYNLLQIFASAAFAIFIQILNYRIQNKGKVLDFLGKISFEVYLVHGLFVKALCDPLISIANGIVYAIAVVVCSVVAGYLLNILVKKINAVILK